MSTLIERLDAATEGLAELVLYDDRSIWGPAVDARNAIVEAKDAIQTAQRIADEMGALISASADRAQSRLATALTRKDVGP